MSPAGRGTGDGDEEEEEEERETETERQRDFRNRPIWCPNRLEDSNEIEIICLECWSAPSGRMEGGGESAVLNLLVDSWCPGFTVHQTISQGFIILLAIYYTGSLHTL